MSIESSLKKIGQGIAVGALGVVLSGCGVPTEVNGYKIVGQIVGKNCNQAGYPVRAGASTDSKVLVPAYDPESNLIITDGDWVVEGKEYKNKRGGMENRWIARRSGNFVAFDREQINTDFGCEYRPRGN